MNFVSESRRVICHNFLANKTKSQSSAEIDGSWAFAGRISQSWTSCSEVTSRSAGCSLCEITIPTGVCELSRGCFYNCRHLVKVTFAQPSSIEDILGSAFAGDDEGGCAFAEICIPNSVRQIGEKCFYNCLLSRVTFSSGSHLVSIGESAFYW